MNVNIRGENIEMTDALRNYVEKKIGKLERYFDTPLNTDVNVTMSVFRGEQIVEVTIPLKGVLLRAEERSEDMYASIDVVVDKLERQIRKYKTKVNRKFRQDGSIRALINENVESTLNEDVEEEEEFQIVRTKRFPMKPMDPEEAILQMNLLGHNFFVFSNMDTDEINVVYKRNDGKYGLIEPAN